MNTPAVDFFGKLKPSLSRRFMSADAATRRFTKYLSAASGTAIKASRYQPINNFLISHSAGSSEMIKFDHRKCF
jgi:hypothetical protein